MSTYIGRFAPSPTGPLHMGSLVTAVASFLDAKVHGGKWLLRIEDVDTGRCRSVYTEDILRCLTAHGLHWQEKPMVQSQQYNRYEVVLNELRTLGVVYACACTRADIAARHNQLMSESTSINASNAGDKIYPGTCRHGMAIGKMQRTWRIALPNKTIVWHDRRLNVQEDNPALCVGDLVLKHIDGSWAYALAVVADDAASGVNHVVRGMDLKASTAAQIQMLDWLGHPTPQYLHIPLLYGKDGRKLSKQNGATAVNANTPLENLNQAWQHLSLCLAHSEPIGNQHTFKEVDIKHGHVGPFQPISALNPQEWLSKATQAWGLYLQSIHA